MLAIIKSWRFLILRRLTQFGTILLFVGSLHGGWSWFGQPLLRGDLSASFILGTIPLADPFAVLQIFFTGHLAKVEVWIGAIIILVFYGLLGGRTWCAWVCPVNLVTDLAGWLHHHTLPKNLFSLPRNLRYLILLMALLLSAIIGLPAFEWVSPIGAMHREILFGLGLGWTGVLGIFLFDWLVVKQGWCGHLCPLGGFYSLLGRYAQLRVQFNASRCTHCGECGTVCPEPQVLNLKQLAKDNQVLSGACTNCGRCIPICPEHSLQFGWRGTQLTNTYYPPQHHLGEN